MLSQNKILKLVVLGEGRVGKTSLTLRYCSGQFDDNQESTINASYLEKQVTLQNADVVSLAIWDTAGQEKFNALAPMYYRDAVGAIIVYDITYKESFDRVNKWLHELKQFADQDIIICIAGNKSDCELQRQISKQQAEQYAEGLGAQHFNVSAKSNLGVDDLFKSLTQQMVDQKNKKAKGKKQKGKLIMEEDDFKAPDNRPSKLKNDKKKDKKSDGCC